MKIPRKLNISGQIVKITQKRYLNKDLKNHVGRAVFSSNSIELSKKCLGDHVDEQYMAVTLLHEIIHHIDHKMGVGLKEAQVDRLAVGIYQVLKDNKLQF
jgi:predicted SprT family Zn-dependent metalloprotease